MVVRCSASWACSSATNVITSSTGTLYPPPRSDFQTDNLLLVDRSLDASLFAVKLDISLPCTHPHITIAGSPQESIPPESTIPSPPHAGHCGSAFFTGPYWIMLSGGPSFSPLPSGFRASSTTVVLGGSD